MTHEFHIGDIVRLRGTEQVAEVIGLKESTGSEGPLLHIELLGSRRRIYFPVKSTVLLSRANETQVGHPQKIET